MKQAWLVIAHNEFEILQMLIDALDHPGSDIYVHIDKKVKNIPRLRAGKSNLYVLERRLDVRWGADVGGCLSRAILVLSCYFRDPSSVEEYR